MPGTPVLEYRVQTASDIQSGPGATLAGPGELAREAMLAGTIFPTMMRLALPMMGVLVAQTLVGVAEIYYVGRLGTDALVGVALVFPIWMLLTTISNGGIGSGVSSAVARAIGSRRHADANALVLHSITLAIVFGLITTFGMYVFGPALYHALGGRGGALRAAIEYSNYVFVGAIPIWIANFLACALRGIGNVRVPAAVTLGGALVLIPVSPAFIFGIGPIPGLGVAGAGLAVTLYYTAASAVLLWYMLRGRSGLRLAWGPHETRLFRDILGVGVVSAVGALQLNLTVILVTGAVGRFGTDALAGYGTASRLDYLMTPLLFGLATAVLTMVGANIGAGSRQRAIRIAWTGTAIAMTISELIGLTVAAFPKLWLGLFTTEPAVVSAGASYLRIVGPTYFAMTAAFVLGFAAQGSGHPLWPVLGSTLRLGVAAGVGWIAVAAFDVGLTALFAIVAAGSLCAGAVAALATYLGATIPREDVSSPRLRFRPKPPEASAPPSRDDVLRTFITTFTP
jgi:putative MATE family efflux protein